MQKGRVVRASCRGISSSRVCTSLKMLCFLCSYLHCTIIIIYTRRKWGRRESCQDDIWHFKHIRFPCMKYDFLQNKDNTNYRARSCGRSTVQGKYLYCIYEFKSCICNWCAMKKFPVWILDCYITKPTNIANAYYNVLVARHGTEVWAAEVFPLYVRQILDWFMYITLHAFNSQVSDMYRKPLLGVR